MTFRVAIVGMACRFPKAPDAATFWQNITRGVDATSPYPMAERWGKDAAYYDPAAEPSLDRVYCRRGGVVDNLRFNPMDYGVVPREVDEADADQFVMLDLAREALRDAGIERSGREKTPLHAGVIVGRTMPIGPVVLRYLDRIKLLPQLTAELRAACVGDAEIARFTQAFLDQRQAGFSHSRTRNLVAGFTAARITNRLNLSGPNYILDAACASSLIAIENAMLHLARGNCDLMLAGGVHLPLTQGYWSMFTNIGALSRRECISPFDQQADGLLLGEGAGLVVLKPLVAAQADGDRIYAVIDGIGSSSDGREESLLAPSSDGQCRAFAQAWRQARRRFDEAAYVECHGTGMPRGDEVESASLCATFGRGRQAVALGSVKSMIGHTLGAAGIASVIKMAFALEQDVMPPSLHCGTLRRDLASAGFYVPDRATPWPREAARVAGVSAFGFGGVNAHLVMSAPPSRKQRRPAAASRLRTQETVLRIAAASAAELLRAMEQGAASSTGPVRLVVFDPTPERLALARKVVAAGKRWSGRHGVFFSPDGVLAKGGKLAFLYPGLGDQVGSGIDGLARDLGLDVTIPAGADQLVRTSLASVHSSYTLAHALMRLRVKPDAVAGHSLGEWTACVSAGVIEPGDLRQLVSRFGVGQSEFMARNYHLLAVWCGVDRLASLLADIEDIAVAVDNCPGHAVVCGTSVALDKARQRFTAHGLLNLDLGIEAASHTRFNAPSLELIRPIVENLALAAPRIPLWSSSLAGPFPPDAAAVRRAIFENMARPVRFRELVEALYADGFRAFVQLGNAGLSGFVTDTLQGREMIALDAARTDMDAESALRRVAAGLYVEGMELDLAGFGLVAQRTTAGAATAGGSAVSLDRSLVEIVGLPDRPGCVAESDPELEALAVSETARELMRASALAFRQAQSSVMGAVAALATHGHADESAAARRGGDALPPPGPVYGGTIRIDHAQYPELFDHEIYRSADEAPIADRSAVAPMAMMIELAIAEVRRCLPGFEVLTVRKVVSFRFIDVKGPVVLDVRIARREDGAFTVVFGEHFSCVVTVARTLTAMPAPDPARWQVADRPAPHPIPFADIYRERWLFHGPRYQGLCRIDAMDATGARGTVRYAGGKGSLMDSAFQMAGMWFHCHYVVDSVVMPLKIEQIELFVPPAVLEEPGEFDCRVFVDQITDNEFVYSLELARAGRVCLRIGRFAGRRFETDTQLGAVFRTPERDCQVCDVLDDRVFVFAYTYRTNWIRVMLQSTYLDNGEVARLDGLRMIQQRNASLMGLVAAKEATKRWMFRQEGFTALHPTDIRIEHDPHGAPAARVAGREAPLHLSISHKPQYGVALVGGPARVGVDIELIEPRLPAFEELNFDDDERALLDRHPPALRPYLVTLLWTAKEAYAKYTGEGIGGSPRRIRVRQVHADADGARGEVEGVPFVSRRYRNQAVISWIIVPPLES
ncbi:beta-ketoacyl synthase N-terminal-like domain-containing protein [Tahibacter amnicola]|uniref:Polyketide synthase dehydratase domain-containing protein n=1 Tax=Tahibacter amnicola TaxID=2976241 RepID=A0ABY6BGX1_9GAMM|nr:beta-ketoacyl synthase N-terminal-like domain-containing protein [Tahibacter amnicola]UXI69009.1 polyketide synthase dehydratase domain-containing protein [Tahibacter amnicola]